MSKLNKFLIASGFIGPIIFFSTVYFIFNFMVPGYDPRIDYISEFGAADSPIRAIANVFGFSLMGVFLMLFSFGIFRAKGFNVLIKISAILFFIGGVSIYLTGIFPGDFICPGKIGCNGYSIRQDIHNQVSSTYPFLVLTVGFILFAIGALFLKGLRFLTPTILILGLITWWLASKSVFAYGEPPALAGLWQRAAIGVPFSIIMIIGVVLYKKLSKL